MQANVVLVQTEPRGPSQLVEIPVAVSGTNKVQLPDIQQLRSDQTQQIIIKGMRLITTDVLTNGMIQAGPNAPVTELQKISLTLYAEGWEKGQLIPLLTMNDMTFAGSTFPHNYGPMQFNNWSGVDWSKSYLQFANGTVSAGAPYVVLIDVCYIRMKQILVTMDNGATSSQWVEIIGPN